MKKCLVASVLAIVVLAGFLANFAETFAASDVLTAEKEQSVVSHCSIIKDNLKNLQHEDSKMRVNLGKYYETILSNFITPLNVVLVANNMSKLGLIENQNEFTLARSRFASDYINYQKQLEDLVALDCRAEPAKFYNKLTSARAERKKVAADVAKLKTLISKQKELVTTLKEAL